MKTCNECQRLAGDYRALMVRLTAAQRGLASYDASRKGEFIELWKGCHSALHELWRTREETLAHAKTHQAETGRERSNSTHAGA